MMNQSNNNSTYSPPWLPQKDGFQPIQQDDDHEANIPSNTTPNTISSYCNTFSGVSYVHWAIKLVSIALCGLMMATAIIGIGKIGCLLK